MIQLLITSFLMICFFSASSSIAHLPTKNRRHLLDKTLEIKDRAIMKVLVVDDNRILTDTIQEILENDGFDVMSAKDGLDGYSTYLLFKPDIIITDIQMPRKNGLEMMKRIRIHNPMIKTIYMTGNIGSFEPFLIEEKKRYPVSYFEKPFSLESLIRVVTEPTVN
jgi:CheY-like chemotaxis protein